MSGTYAITLPSSSTLQLFPCDPLTKTPRLQRIATGGQGKPIFSAFFIWEFGWGAGPRSDATFFESRYVNGGLFNAQLPHPVTGNLTGFTGVAIDDFSFTVNDVERGDWIDSYRLTLRVSLYATGSV